MAMPCLVIREHAEMICWEHSGMTTCLSCHARVFESGIQNKNLAWIPAKGMRE